MVELDSYVKFPLNVYHAEARKLPPYNLITTPKWRLLVFWMRRLRCNWTGRRKSPYLLQIYKTLPEVIAERIVPLEWIKIVNEGANAFDGVDVDGRVMRGIYENLFNHYLDEQQRIQFFIKIEGLGIEDPDLE